MTDISPASKFDARKCRAALDELRLTCLITRTSKWSEVNPANSDRVARDLRQYCSSCRDAMCAKACLGITGLFNDIRLIP
jgi:hypothetical protein